MSPTLELNPTESNFLNWWLDKMGAPISGQAFRVAFAPAGGQLTERMLVLGPNKIEADADVLVAIRGYLAGPEAFVEPVSLPSGHRPPSVPFPDPTQELAELFPGARIPNALARKGITTTAQLLAILGREDGEAALLALKHIGPASVAEINRRLLGV